MCGIAGLYHYQSDLEQTPPARCDIERMCSMMVHRGPDDAGYFVENPIALGMRRLSIIDIDSGAQPLFNDDKSIVVVANGEIYNYRQLRDQLKAKGIRFRTDSDCEVIPHLYQLYGLSFVEKLRGMFAIALWDKRQKRLLLVRDRIGIKPLYYADHEGKLALGSELKVVASSKTFKRQVDPQSLHHYLSLNYLPDPHTMLKGVKQLQPGSLLVCDSDGIKIRSYWDLRFETDNTHSPSYWKKAIREKLQECVDSYLVSDVPFGAFLSGGLDSSAVVALMSQSMNQPLSTFSIDFNESSYSEAHHARSVADQYQCKHHEFKVNASIVDHLSELIWYADDPLADSSMLPVYLLAKNARDHVKMVLTGDGGDEVFAGYETYQAYFIRQLYRKVPATVRKTLVKNIVNRLPVALTKVSFDYKAKRFVSGAELSAEEAHFWWRAIFSETEKESLYNPAFRASLFKVPTQKLYEKAFRESQSDDPLARMLYVDTRLYLPADMLTKVDRMTMANALEARVPLLDHELVELVAKVPSSLKLRHPIMRPRKKHIFKEAVADLLPSSIIDRKKAGFNVPVNAWLANELKAQAQSVLKSDQIRSSGFFDPAAIDILFEEHGQRADHSYRIWSLLCFELWRRQFIEPDELSPPPAVKARWF